ncbi:hemerythrin domain-containing protein [Kutzneria sp. NPDC052558]|uniref:hemerythrin domain-containing protein n=1 Tax=Kutzneria sp. NPDC052558 TaxID=3364121 RepID=UPI0037CC3D67
MTLADVRGIYMVHTMLQRELGLMPELVRTVASGDVDRARVVTEHIELVADLLRQHDLVEERHLWPRLLDRLPAEAAPLVRAMEREHRLVDDLQERLEPALAAWRIAAGQAGREAVAAVLDALILALADHLAREEDRVLPLAARCVTTAEWAEMLADGARCFDLDSLVLFCGMIRYDADPAVFRATVESMPETLRAVVFERCEQAFAEYALGVYGTATPPHAPGPPSFDDGPCSLPGIA